MDWEASRRMARRFEGHALTGDCETAALVSRDGAIDWLCWPRFEPAAFRGGDAPQA